MEEEIYVSRDKRDIRAKELRDQGYHVRRHSWKNQFLHPEYVVDWPERPSPEDKGVGNKLYRTHFTKLYVVSYEKIS